MKKITLAVFLFFTLITLQIQSQAFAGAGMYRIKVIGEDLCFTLPDTNPIASGQSQELTYKPVNNNNNAQIFQILQRSFTDNDVEVVFWEIRSVLTGKGAVVILNNQSDASPIGCKNTEFNENGNTGRLDFWNPTRDAGTSIFSENNDTSASWNGKAKRRIQTAIIDGVVKLGGGTSVKFDFIPATPSTASVDSFKLTSNDFVISNISKKEVKISSTTTKINKIEIYNILGKNVLAKKYDDSTIISLNTSSISTGLYILKIDTDKGVYSTKIISE
jgi:hypothetical protein